LGHALQHMALRFINMFQVVVLHTLCNTIIIVYSYSHYIHLSMLLQHLHLFIIVFSQVLALLDTTTIAMLLPLLLLLPTQFEHLTQLLIIMVQTLKPHSLIN